MLGFRRGTEPGGVKRIESREARQGGALFTEEI